MEIKYYIAEDGRSPIKEWQNALQDSKTRAKIDARLTLLSLGGFGERKSVGDGVHELIIDYGPGYRIYFAPHGKEIVVLLCAGTKKRQQRDIDLAKVYWTDYKRTNESKGKSKKQ